MLRNALFLALVASAAVFAAPTPAPVTDTDILQFALTLEHLESAFYSGGLAKYDADAFEKAGFAPWVRGRFEQIAEHEASHVKFLTTALGDNATKPCVYDFPYDSPESFAELSMALESVGDAAYLGAAHLVSDKGVLTDAASILSVEGRHAGWVSASVLKNQPWNGPFDAPITPSGAFSLASQFIKSCPSTNPSLPVQAFPALTLTSSSSGSSVSPGHAVSLDFDKRPANASVAWLSGLDVVYSDLDGSGKTTVPQGLMGTVFATAVSSKDAPPSDANMLSGFAIVQIPFDSRAANA
ncbi:ferritin-like domain-containing protein [Cubamyces menziesii]|nr:ferritin-like domain-containing protein [Cubamyces menziesii]